MTSATCNQDFFLATATHIVLCIGRVVAIPTYEHSARADFQTRLLLCHTLGQNQNNGPVAAGITQSMEQGSP